MRSSGIIYYHDWQASLAPQTHVSRPSKAGYLFAVGLLAVSLGGITGPFIPAIRMESQYRTIQARAAIQRFSHVAMQQFNNVTMRKQAPTANPSARTVQFTPLTTPDGSSIDPMDTNFGLVIPKIGVNASVIPAVNPTKPGEYLEALQKGIAHSSLSYFPDEDGTVYLFSHSTNYDWFVKDLNAAFYLLKNLDIGDRVVLFYKGKQYEYKITDKRVVSPEAVSYLVPEAGAKRLILQTCWPPGSTSERLLIFADYIEDSNSVI